MFVYSPSSLLFSRSFASSSFSSCHRRSSQFCDFFCCSWSLYSSFSLSLVLRPPDHPLPPPHPIRAKRPSPIGYILAHSSSFPIACIYARCGDMGLKGDNDDQCKIIEQAQKVTTATTSFKSAEKLIIFSLCVSIVHTYIHFIYTYV